MFLLTAVKKMFFFLQIMSSEHITDVQNWKGTRKDQQKYDSQSLISHNLQ